jgi:hypothetical protein
MAFLDVYCNIFHSEVRVISCRPTSVWAGRHPPWWRWDSLEHEREWAVTHFKMAWIMKNFRFSQRCMWSLLSCVMSRHVTQYFVPNVSDNSVVRKCQQKIMNWRSATFQLNGTFCTFVWKWWILVFRPPHSVRSAHIIVIILKTLLSQTAVTRCQYAPGQCLDGSRLFSYEWHILSCTWDLHDNLRAITNS